jgi:hypothetical protein
LNGERWVNGTEQFVYSYPPYFHFASNEFDLPLNILYRNQTILMAGQSVQIYDDNLNILWDSVTLKRASTNIIVTVQTRIANALLFFLDGQYLGEFDNHDHTAGNIQAIAALDISQFKSNQ